MKNEKLVSIIMPAKNAAAYLEACLESIINQSYVHWELLVTNDHSTDDTLSIIEAFSKRDNRIHVFQNKGKGIIPALQTAYANAKGTLITRMDADDLMSKDKMEWLVKTCKNENTLATGLVRYFSDHDLGEGYQKYTAWLNANLQSENPFQDIYKECVIPSPCWMLHKTTFEYLGAFDGDRYPEDYDLCFRMRQANLAVHAVDQVLHHWRDYPTRSSRTDENYLDNRFLDIKVHYFLQDDLDTDKALVLWGAGKKGKTIAKLLAAQGVAFHWISNNPKKIGHTIHEVIIQGEEILEDHPSAQVIVAVAAPEDQSYIADIVGSRVGVRGYWFC